MLTIFIATFVPLLIFIGVGFSKRSSARTDTQYFICDRSVSASDYANTSVGYALQMAAVFLFATWAILYGWGALWTAAFWCLGYVLLYFLLPRFLPYHAQSAPLTLHEYLARCYGDSKAVQRTAAVATFLGLGGTMMAEIDYTVQVYLPLLPRGGLPLTVGFLILGLSYIVVNGYKAEVNVVRYQVPFAYCALISVLLLALPRVWQVAGPRAHSQIQALLLAVFVAMVAAKLTIKRGSASGWRVRAHDPQIIIPLVGLLCLWIEGIFVSAVLPPGNAPTILDSPVKTQVTAQGLIALSSLFIANVLWMPVDLSTWQRIGSVAGTNNKLLRNLRAGTFRIMLESPASWCLGVALGLIIHAGGFMAPNDDPWQAVALFSHALAGTDGRNVEVVLVSTEIVYGLFVAACVAVMLSTVSSLLSAIGYTAYRDIVGGGGTGLKHAQVTTAVVVVISFVGYEFLRGLLDASLATVLYGAYSAQLSLIIVVLFALFQRKLSKRGAIVSIVFGLTGTGISTILAARTPGLSILPPLIAVGAAILGYILGYRHDLRKTLNRHDSPSTASAA